MDIGGNIGNDQRITVPISENIRCFAQQRLETIHQLRGNGTVQLNYICLDFIGLINQIWVCHNSFHRHFHFDSLLECRNQQGIICPNHGQVILSKDRFNFFKRFVDCHILEVGQCKLLVFDVVFGGNNRQVRLCADELDQALQVSAWEVKIKSNRCTSLVTLGDFHSSLIAFLCQH